MEKKNILANVIRLSDGTVTCANGGAACTFLVLQGIVKGEKAFTCCFLKPKIQDGPRPELIRDPNTGWLIPHSECPMNKEDDLCIQ